MSDEVPPLAPGFVRIAVLLPQGSPLTPGDLARASGLPGEALGPVLRLGEQALLDVVEDRGQEARAALEQIGPTQLTARKVEVERFSWLRLEVGRNHGLTMKHLGKVLSQHGVERPGRIHVNNTHTLVGVPAQLLDGLIAALAELRLNGARVRPSRGEVANESAVYRRRGSDRAD